MNYWDQLRNYLQQKVSAEGFDNWLKGTALVGQEGDTLYVSVPDRETRAWRRNGEFWLFFSRVWGVGASFVRGWGGGRAGAGAGIWVGGVGRGVFFSPRPPPFISRLVSGGGGGGPPGQGAL